MTLENVTIIKEKIRPNLTRKLKNHRFAQVKAMDFIKEAQKRVAATEATIEQFVYFNNSDVPPFMMLMDEDEDDPESPGDKVAEGIVKDNM